MSEFGVFVGERRSETDSLLSEMTVHKKEACIWGENRLPGERSKIPRIFD